MLLLFWVQPSSFVIANLNIKMKLFHILANAYLDTNMQLNMIFPIVERCYEPQVYQHTKIRMDDWNLLFGQQFPYSMAMEWGERSYYIWAYLFHPFKIVCRTLLLLLLFYFCDIINGFKLRWINNHYVRNMFLI